jgi:polysaccharide biosynthesis protein PelA
MNPYTWLQLSCRTCCGIRPRRKAGPRNKCGVTTILWGWMLLFCIFPPLHCFAQERPIPRVLMALYDSRDESSPRATQIHRFLEMPANHLGYDIHYHDINVVPLPPLGDDVAGIVLWLNIGDEVPDAEHYLAWLEHARVQDKKIILIENAGINERHHKNPELVHRWNAVLNYIGVQDEDRWNEITYHAAVEHSDSMIGFEHRVGPVLPPFPSIHATADQVTSHLRLRVSDVGQDETFDLVTTGAHGGFIAPGYALFEDEEKLDISGQEDTRTLWIVNPFLFLRTALGDELGAVPDVTTLYGRRIFYSHIDGDGWNNVSEVLPYQDRKAISAEVVYNEILRPYNDFPFNVALITADIDPECYGVEGSERMARNIFALPNVEPSSHTYSHPLFWEFFEHYNPESEKPFLKDYPPRPKNKFSVVESIKSTLSKDEWQEKAFASSSAARTYSADAAPKPIKRGKNEESVEEVLKKNYPTPRSYACSPFNLEQEISGSIRTINALSPKDKQVRLVQWSGNTHPFEAAIALTRKEGKLNINGGDSRFDEEYPSYTCVAPIGVQIGNERQIYSSNSNEDTYTNLWTERFFGYRYLKTTVQNTENPLRVSAFNMYFHIFSGEKQASLSAIKENLAFARTQEIIPITASHYAAIADGFYTARISQISNSSWHVSRRGELQTLRFDNAAGRSVDLSASRGVLGQRYIQHNLYVSLDPALQDAVITLKANAHKDMLPEEETPYLIDSRWEVQNFQIATHDGWSFTTQGYGAGNMRWKVPPKREYLLTVTSSHDKKPISTEKHVMSDNDGVLSFALDQEKEPVSLEIAVRAAAR